MALAAYAEGRLDAASADHLEAAIASDTRLLADVQAARAVALGDVAAIPAPLSTIRNARALVREPPPPAWRRALGWSSVAAAIILVAAVGFEFGQATADSLQPRLEADFSLDPDSVL
jgi:anti-sigma factor RsiW